MNITEFLIFVNVNHEQTDTRTDTRTHVTKTIPASHNIKLASE